jgi:hypothetical protein
MRNRKDHAFKAGYDTTGAVVDRALLSPTFPNLVKSRRLKEAIAGGTTAGVRIVQQPADSLAAFRPESARRRRRYRSHPAR